MSFFGLTDANAASTLFSSLGGSSIAGAGGSSILADYAGIRNGSYHKLLKAYYSETGSSAVSDVVEGSTSTSTAKDSAKTLAKIEEASGDLKDSADALLTRGSKDPFQKVTTTDQNGAVSQGYDTKAIYDKVKDYVDSYNSVVKATEDSKTGSITRTASQMTGTTEANRKLLEAVGISINKDNTLSLDQDTFQKADMEKVKALFQGNGSYAYQVSVKSSLIDYYAQKEASKANTYGKNGTYNYNYNYGGSYNGYI